MPPASASVLCKGGMRVGPGAWEGRSGGSGAMQEVCGERAQGRDVRGEGERVVVAGVGSPLSQVHKTYVHTHITIHVFALSQVNCMHPCTHTRRHVPTVPTVQRPLRLQWATMAAGRASPSQGRKSRSLLRGEHTVWCRFVCVSDVRWCVPVCTLVRAHHTFTCLMLVLFRSLALRAVILARSLNFSHSPSTPPL